MISGNGEYHLNPTQSSLPRGRALLVDEDGKDLKRFSNLLASMGYSVRAFMSYLEAEKCLERVHFEFVIVTQVSSAFETQPLVEFTGESCWPTRDTLPRNVIGGTDQEDERHLQSQDGVAAGVYSQGSKWGRRYHPFPP